MLKLIFTGFFSFLFLAVLAQDRCGTVEYEKLRALRNPRYETVDQFEKWMSQLLKKKSLLNSSRTQGSAYVVPIVVHVIHNGEAVGSGTNISDAQILSQIAVLNNDYARLNADTTKTPSEFQPVAGKFPVTFVMAQQDPNGLSTNGIVRVKGTKSSWGLSDNYTFKALSYWPAEDYLNIWVLNLSGSLLGFTQLPISSTLPGLNDASEDRITDGVTIDYQAYGTTQATGGSSFNLLSEYALGRTATHEIGHFFGLRHVWGDVDSCDPSVSTDYVSDTPIQNTNYNGLCPSGTQTECGGNTMYDNYMNYTDDSCMNIFSQGQVARMDVIINNSPRRVSLLNSPGAQLPAPVANDMGIKSILAPGMTACSGSLTPSLDLRNYGSNTVTSVEIQFSMNGTVTQTQTYSSLNLSPASETSISFSSVSLTAGSSYNFSFHIIQTNGGTDGSSANDTLSVTTQIPVPASLPLYEPFSTYPSNWQISNPDGLITWSNISLTGSTHAMYLDFFDYENSGASDLLITPVLDLTTDTIASINFDYAYAMYQGGSDDGLRVLVSTVCDFDSSPVQIFSKSGSALATAQATGSVFTPTSSQWATSIISLNQFLGKRIQIAFEGVNGYGNNLYIGNVEIFNSAITSIALNGIVSPSPVTCTSNLSPMISVKNQGNIPVTSFTANVYVNNERTTELVSGIELGVGATENITLASATFSTGNNDLSIDISLPNGNASAISSGDSLHTAVTINTASDYIPLRENFNGNFSSEWTIVNPQSGLLWNKVFTNDSTSLAFQSFQDPNLGDQAWLVSPSLDFSDVKTASVFFQSSYAYNPSGSEILQVFSSVDCGLTFDNVLFTSSGSSLANANTTISWLPTKASQWTTNYLNLDTLAGKKNVRLAFVATNGDGNNLYIDNIEFFTDDLQVHTVVNSLYSVYGGGANPVKVTFNLPDRQLVRLQAYDLTGHIITDNLLQETLNQTYTIDFPETATGLYIIRIQTATTVSSTKVLLGF